MTILDVVAARAASAPDQDAFVFLDHWGHERSRLTYRELCRGARAFAARLQRDLRPGHCAVLAGGSDAASLVAFFGCIHAGVVPALTAAPRHRRDRRNLARLAGVLARTGARRLYLAAESLAALASPPPGCEVVALDEAMARAMVGDEELAARYVRPAIAATAAAYLQFTSGSTSQPRGVVLTHGNVLAGLDVIRQVFGPDVTTRGMTWLPLHHDMGLVGHVLEPLSVGGFSVIAPPALFSLRPLNWLDAVARYGATDSGAPPFAFAHCARYREALSPALDLRSWRNVCCGAETIHPSVLDEFARRFAPAGFNPAGFLPCYGLAEATLLVAGGRHTSGWRRVEADARPPKLAYQLHRDAFDVRVVDPDGCEERPAGDVGEIVVAGDSVARGYYDDPDATRETFVELTFEGCTRTYLRTRDLGRRVGGALVIDGRKDDQIAVRGVKYHPEDLELAVREAEPCTDEGLTVCFSIPGDDTDQVVLVQEVRRRADKEWPAIALRLNGAVAEVCGTPCSAVAFVPRGAVPRTPSGKVSRAACRHEWLAGALTGVAIWQGAPTAAAEDEGGPAAEQRPRNPLRDVAIIGLACRMPGAADAGAFWSLLADGVDAIGEIPPVRWDAELYYDSRPAVPGKANSRWGGFVEGIERFDAEFFGIAPDEAAEMDPQQRLVLEVAWRAIEDAGLTREALAGSDTGVFIGISTTDYLHLQIRNRPGMEGFNAYSGLGSSHSIAANRVSYVLNLRGPSVAVDTACSSSLTAMHLAVQSLRNGECSLAIAGGVNAMLSPGTTVTLSQFGMLAPDGRCKVFDVRADGYVRSEGCGLVVLKRDADARRDGDKILALVRGSALGQDGRSRGITAPNPDAQRDVIERALADAGCTPADVTFVEAHGTGTAAGDHVEVAAIRGIYGADSSSGSCYVGSVKASVGHLEAAAGVASLIKVVLALAHREIPPQLHLETLHPSIVLDGSRLLIPRRHVPWPIAAPARRIAAMSSFGFGGANAHMIVEEAVPAVVPGAAAADAAPALFPLSARTGEALHDLAAACAAFLDGSADGPAVPLAHAHAMRRSHFAHRHAIVASSIAELRRELAAFADAPRLPSARPKASVAFLFSGQGSQYPHMGRDLYLRYPAFRAAFDRCATACATLEPSYPPLGSLVFDAADGVEDAALLQPALFAVSYALAQLWISLGMAPAAVLGHSLGEYAAACVAGCFEPEAGMRLVVARGALVASIPEVGAMAGIAADEDWVRRFLARERFDALDVAAINALESTVVAGPRAVVDAAIARATALGRSARRLRTPQAFHSALMDGILDRFEAVAASVTAQPPAVPFISNVTGTVMTQAPDAAYWRRHLRESVRFLDGARQLAALGVTTGIETGPGGVLSALASSCDARLQTLESMTQPRNEGITLLRSAGRLYAAGAAMRWPALFHGTAPGLPAGFPGHPYYSKPCWFAGDAPAADPTSERSAILPARGTAGDEWRYDVRWERSPVTPDARRALQEDLAQHWIIIGDGAGLASDLAASLSRRGRGVFLIAADGAGRRTVRRTDRRSGAVRFSVPPGCEAGTYSDVFVAITGGVKGGAMSPISRASPDRWNVVYLRPLDGAPAGETTIETLERDQRLCGPADLAAIVVALTRTTMLPRLWLVTDGAQPADAGGGETREARLRVAQAPIWGFGHTLFLEHPEMRGGMVDLDPDQPPDARVRDILDAIAAGDGESLTAFRGGSRHVPRLTPVEEDAPPAPCELRRDGVYLVTGGLGGLGLRFGRWLAERGAGHVALMGRHGLPLREEWDLAPPGSEAARRVEGVRAIERAGATVEILEIDVADHERVAAAVSRLDGGAGRLRGVVHAAGVNWFSRIVEMDRERLLEALKLKVSAAWNLHTLTRGRDLDVFILCSSVSALWGSVNLSHYTAANQFLDALACQRRREGQRALSIDWGPWSTVGMSAGENEIRMLTRLGFRLMPPERAIRALERALRADVAQTVVADINWKYFQAFVNFSGAPSFFRRVALDPASDRVLPRGSKVEAQRILALPREEASRELLALLKQHLAAVLLLEPDQDIDVQLRFNLMGMDSLTAIAFALRLETLAGTHLPTSLAWNYPTLSVLADHLYELMGANADRRPAVPPDTERPAQWFATAPRPQPPGVRLFCFPYAGAGASIYRDWIAALAPDIEVVPVRLPGREERHAEPPATGMRALAAALAEAIAPLTSIRFAFFGHSMGALIAFELARELRRRGRPLPSHLVLSACAPPAAAHATAVHRLPDAEFRDRITRAYGVPAAHTVDDEIWRMLLPVLRADVELMEDCDAGAEPPLEVPVTVFGGRDDHTVPRDRLLAWSTLAGGDFAVRLFPGDHLFIRQAGTALVDAVRACLEPIAPAAAERIA